MKHPAEPLAFEIHPGSWEIKEYYQFKFFRNFAHYLMPAAGLFTLSMAGFTYFEFQGNGVAWDKLVLLTALGLFLIGTFPLRVFMLGQTVDESLVDYPPSLFSISEEGIGLKAEEYWYTFTWEGVRYVRQRKSLLMILLEDGTTTLVPLMQVPPRGLETIRQLAEAKGKWK